MLTALKDKWQEKWGWEGFKNWVEFAEELWQTLLAIGIAGAICWWTHGFARGALQHAYANPNSWQVLWEYVGALVMALSFGFGAAAGWALFNKMRGRRSLPQPQ